MPYPVDKRILNVNFFNWNDLQTFLAARKSLARTAELRLNSESKFKTGENLKEAIIEEFSDKVDSKTIHQLLSRKKKSIKSIFCMWRS